MWGISYPGFYVSAGMIDAHPALKAASPQAPVTDWFMGDDFAPQRRVPARRTPSASTCSFVPRPGRARRRHSRRPRSTTARPTATTSSCEMGPLAERRTRSTSRAPDRRSGTIDLEHPQLRRVLAGAVDLRPHFKDIKPAVLTVGGWFDAEDLFGRAATPTSTIEQTEPGRDQHARDGPVDPRRLVARRRRHGSAPVQLRTRRPPSSTASTIEFPFFAHHLKGTRPTPTLPEALDVRDRDERVARATTRGRRRPRSEDALLPAPAARCRWQRAGRAATASTSTSATRPSRCRSSATRRIGHDRATT